MATTKEGVEQAKAAGPAGAELPEQVVGLAELTNKVVAWTCFDPQLTEQLTPVLLEEQRSKHAPYEFFVPCIGCSLATQCAADAESEAMAYKNSYFVLTELNLKAVMVPHTTAGEETPADVKSIAIKDIVEITPVEEYGVPKCLIDYGGDTYLSAVGLQDMDSFMKTVIETRDSAKEAAGFANQAMAAMQQRLKARADKAAPAAEETKEGPMVEVPLREEVTSPLVEAAEKQPAASATPAAEEPTTAPAAEEPAAAAPAPAAEEPAAAAPAPAAEEPAAAPAPAPAPAAEEPAAAPAAAEQAPAEEAEEPAPATAAADAAGAAEDAATANPLVDAASEPAGEAAARGAVEETLATADADEATDGV